MADDSKNLSGAEEYVAVKIELAASLDPDQEKICETLSAISISLPSIPAVSAEKNLALLRSDADFEEKMVQLIQQGGGKPKPSRAKVRPSYDLGEA